MDSESRGNGDFDAIPSTPSLFCEQMKVSGTLLFLLPLLHIDCGLAHLVFKFARATWNHMKKVKTAWECLLECHYIDKSFVDPSTEEKRSLEDDRCETVYILFFCLSGSISIHTANPQKMNRKRQLTPKSEVRLKRTCNFDTKRSYEILQLLDEELNIIEKILYVSRNQHRGCIYYKSMSNVSAK